MAIRHEKNTFRSIDYNPIFGYIVLTLSHPREVSRTSRGWDRGRWPGNAGAKTYTPPGSRSCTVPARALARHLGLTVAAPYGGYRPPGAVDGPAAVVRLPRLKGKEA